MSARLRVLSRLFTTTHLRELAYSGWTSTLRAAADFLEDEKEVSYQSPVTAIFDSAFKVLHQNYPVEYVYKTSMLEAMRHPKSGAELDSRKTSLYMEFPVAKARADLLLVNGKANVYEVKTKFDSPVRLDKQLTEYYQCFTNVTVVVEESQFNHYEELLPDHVGLSIFVPGRSIEEWREPTRAIEGLDHWQMFIRMHQKERYEIAGDLGINLENLNIRERWQASLDGFTSIPVEDAHHKFVAALKARRPAARLLDFCKKNLPASLHARAFSRRLQKQEWSKLVNLLKNPLGPEPKPDLWL